MLWSGGSRELARAVREFDDAAVDVEACRANAARFDREVFRRRMLAEVEDACAEQPAPGDEDQRSLAATRPVRRAARDRRS